MSKKVETTKKRVIGLIGHGGAGKTQLGDAMIFVAGATDKLGKVDEGTSVLDVEPEEKDIKHTIVPGFYDFMWNGHLIYLIDTPGYSNFIHEAKNALQAVGGAVLVLHAVDGVRVQTEQVVAFAREQNVPLVCFINALDKERADFDRVFKEIEEYLDVNPVAVSIPIGKEANFKGVVDLLANKAYIYETDGSGKIKETTDIPADMQDTVASMRETLIERLVEADDEIMEKYLEGEEVSAEELAKCLKKGTLEKVFMPVFAGSAILNVGVRQLLDGIIAALPNPLEEHARKAIDPTTGEEKVIEMANAEEELLKAIVFKTITDPYAGRINIFRVFHGRLGPDETVHIFGKDGKQTKEKFGKLFKLRGRKQEPIDEALPGDIAAVAKLKETATGDTLTAGPALLFETPQPPVATFGLAVAPKAKGDEDKIANALARMLEEDPGLIMKREPQTNELLIYGMGQQHLEITFNRMKRMYNVEVQTKLPRVPYRETIRKSAKYVEGKVKKQTGGRGQYGICYINMYPLPRGQGFEFVDMIVGGVIPNQFIPAVEKGIREAMEAGPLSGSPVQDIKIELVDGKHHPVDSSEYAFKTAGALAFKAAFEKCDPVLLEPIMKMEILVPEENMGDVIGDLNSRRGKVLGMEAKGKYQLIKAEVPLAEVQTYANTLKSLTGDRGSFTMTFSHYDEVPAQIAEKVIEELRKEKEQSE